MATPTTIQDIQAILKDRYAHVDWADVTRRADCGDEDDETTRVRAYAEQIIRIEDLALAPGSETSLYGAALRDVAQAGPEAIADTLLWWADAYEAWDINASDEVYDRIFDGDSGGALTLARESRDAYGLHIDPASDDEQRRYTLMRWADRDTPETIHTFDDEASAEDIRGLIVEYVEQYGYSVEDAIPRAMQEYRESLAPDEA